MACWAAIYLGAALLVSNRRESLLPWAALAAALCVTAYAGVALWLDWERQSLAIVTSLEAVARLSPADRAGIAEKLPAGSRVLVLSERGDWIYCQLPGDQRGWLPGGSAERIRPVRS